MRKFCSVETVLNIYEPRKWYAIPGFRGYEISNDHYIRSMKHYKKYPFGILITPIKKDPYNPVFELSDDDCTRVSMSLNEILYIVRNTPVEVGYPRATIVTNISSRNLRITRKNKKQISDSPTNKYHMAYDPIVGAYVPINTNIGDKQDGRKDSR